MFATVRFGANCQEMVNLLCCVQTLTGHLKWKCQCRPEDCIDLMDEKGTLMNLSKVEDPASEYASKYLQGRQRYILIRAVREENSEATCYESLLEDLGKHYPDLPGLLWAVRAVRHQGEEEQGCWAGPLPVKSDTPHQDMPTQLVPLAEGHLLGTNGGEGHQEKLRNP
nr:uncharacterized protein C22orf15 homolog isoform X1 [Taeniopygia guttata]XP_041575362.1 uncharacterized protein C22orf15 homolog isoform X1 [Taeniopygia guttata]